MLDLIAIGLGAVWLVGLVLAVSLCRAASASRSVGDLFNAERVRRAAKAEARRRATPMAR